MPFYPTVIPSELPVVYQYRLLFKVALSLPAIGPVYILYL